MSGKEWIKFARELKSVLEMDLEPVALNRLRDDCGDRQEKVRMCRAIIEASQGKTLDLCKHNNACFGATWHLGFKKIKDPQVKDMVRQFVVKGEKLFSSYEALDKLIAQMGEVPDHSDKSFRLTPLESCESQPELVLFLCDANQACRLLTLVTFEDGLMPDIKIGGPTCRMAVTLPLATGKLNISFYDYTARKLCNLDNNLLLISVPYCSLDRMVENIEKCSAGKAKIEYPQGFREFLQKRKNK
ncbi:MAG: hypothetical protein GF375_01980 [Candidatus Omnitrophica bacterium]|nr:hypothetical protein [Candidatus Omnitrophota bacterium]MBD3268893.1 hypothetical protein [Candidatus Omnitrophota bacterium]